MSLIKLFRKKNHEICLTTPSHGQHFFIFNKFRNFYKYDISETEVYNPQKALDLAQKKASEIYGTKSTYFLTNGSTSGIIAAVLACAKNGDNVLIAENSHICHKNAVELAGANCVFYKFNKIKNLDIDDKISCEELENIFKKQKIKALVITNPTYFGIVSDVQTISDLCKKWGVYLIVDEAHGALYPFSEDLPTSAIYQGADFVIQSLHKTAGGLNPTALLHCNCDLDTKSALEKIMTTSPSYPLLATIEANINFLNSKRGRKKISELVQNIKEMRKNLKEIEFFGDDITKIIVKSPVLKGFEDEIESSKCRMFLTGIGTDLKKIKKLEKSLRLWLNKRS